MVETERTPHSGAGRRSTRKPVKYIAGGILIVLAAAYLIYSAAEGSLAYYLTVSELEEAGPQTRDVRVAGHIVPGSIVWTPEDLILEFEIRDDGGTLPVTYTGVRPDMFREEAEIVVVGRPGADHVFQAHTLILKCPSKYEEAR
jgi:cytochrome c-type biogenesis protein CcmE